MKKTIMSLIALLTIMVFSAPLTSCSSSDDDNDNSSELTSKIIGKWRIIQVEQNDGSMMMLLRVPQNWCSSQPMPPLTPMELILVLVILVMVQVLTK